jgi:uncharacterized membrane protein YjjB (DUF3815 family)
MILCFSFEFEAHKKSIWRIFLCGGGGALTFYCTTFLGQIYISTFLASFVIGILSFKISRYYKHPSQIYSAPSILSLVPGMLAFSSLSSHINAGNSGPIPFVKALLVSLSIVFGLILGRLGSTDETII